MITLTLVFLCGAAAGAVVMNFGLHNWLHQPAFDTAAGRELYFSRMKRELDLTPAQQEQMESSPERLLAVLPHRAERQQIQGRTDPQRGAEASKFERILQERQPK